MILLLSRHTHVFKVNPFAPNWAPSAALLPALASSPSTGSRDGHSIRRTLCELQSVARPNPDQEHCAQPLAHMLRTKILTRIIVPACSGETKPQPSARRARSSFRLHASGIPATICTKFWPRGSSSFGCPSPGSARAGTPLQRRAS